MKMQYEIHGAQRIVNALQVALPKEIPYVAAKMLTRLAGDIQEGFSKRLPAVFDRPTDFTLKSLRRTAADKYKLQEGASVFVAQSGEGESREYMRTESLGSDKRPQKKTERLLSQLGYLPKGWVTVPGKGIEKELDEHGNLPGPVYRQIINVLQLKAKAEPSKGWKRVSERSARRATQLGVASLFFVVKVGPNKLGKNGGYLPSGVWRHEPGHRVVRVLAFVKRAPYGRRFEVKPEASIILYRQIRPRWNEAVKEVRAIFERNASR